MNQKRINAAFHAVCYMAIAAFGVSMVDRYSPVWSWQTAVVVGGGIAVYIGSLFLQLRADK